MAHQAEGEDEAVETSSICGELHSSAKDFESLEGQV
jgi:hypothetical protein